MSRLQVIFVGLQDALRAIRKIYLAVQPRGAVGPTGDLTALIWNVALQAAIEAGKIAPRYTGTLAGSHRRVMISNRVGEVYLDPAIKNLTLGGYPAVYGPIVHRMGYPRNWMERTVNEKGRKIVERAGDYWLKRSFP